MSHRVAGWRVAAPIRLLAVLTLAAATLGTASAIPRVIVYFSAATTLREVYSSDRPNLRKVMAKGGSAALVLGPADRNPEAAAILGRYARSTPSQGALPDGVLLIRESAERPTEGDRALGKAMQAMPDAPVIALCAHPPVPPGKGGTPSSLMVPGWIGVSHLHGRLTSDTTRTAGAVSVQDVAPTVAALCHVAAPHGAAGHVVKAARYSTLPRGGMPAHVASAMRWQTACIVLAGATNPTNFALAFGSIALILGAMAVTASEAKARTRRRWQAALLLPLCAPIGVAVSAGRLPTTAEGYYLVAMAVTACVWGGVLAFGRALSAAGEEEALCRVMLGAAGLCAFVTADVMRHGLALRLSPLSSFYMTGIRFYGLGNEYAALFLAATAIAAGAAVQRIGGDRIPGYALAGLAGTFLAACIVVGAPFAGANMGGLLAAIATLGSAWALLRDRTGVRTGWGEVAAVGAALVALVLLREAHTTHPTHVGRFLHAGAPHWKAILASKAAISGHLMVSPPAWAIYAVSLLAVWLLRGPLAAVRRRTETRYPFLLVGARASLIGGVAGALLNDTGIVMLGLMAVLAIGAATIAALQPRGLETL